MNRWRINPEHHYPLHITARSEVDALRIRELMFDGVDPRRAARTIRDELMRMDASFSEVDDLLEAHRGAFLTALEAAKSAAPLPSRIGTRAATRWLRDREAEAMTGIPLHHLDVDVPKLFDSERGNTLTAAELLCRTYLSTLYAAKHHAYFSGPTSLFTSISAIMDSRCCSECRPWNGVIFRRPEIPPVPRHLGCRCGIVSVPYLEAIRRGLARYGPGGKGLELLLPPGSYWKPPE
jgi:hypothetical protein